LRANVVRTANTSSETTICGWSDLCFCGAYTCQLPKGWRQAFSFKLNGRRLGSAGSKFRYQTVINSYSVPSNLQAVVDVAFGLEVIGGSPLLGVRPPGERWKFSDTFDIADPWAQRHMYTFCTKLPKELRVVQKICVIEAVRDYLVKQNADFFPIKAARFQSRIQAFFKDAMIDNLNAKDFFWLRNGKVKAVKMMFIVDFSKNSATEVAAAYKKVWDDHVDAWNVGASDSAKGAWHTSHLWVRAEAQRELISSTISTLLVIVVMAFLSMLMFTLDPLLSVFVVVATVGEISGLAFFIVVVMGLAIGPIEAIALIVFIGYAVTYSLHIAHKYTSSEALGELAPPGLEEGAAIRAQRTAFALKSIGGATLGSATTTIGCAIFLLFCTLSIFRRLGGVVLAVTVMSILSAFGPLSAALFIAGPLRPGQALACLHRLRGHKTSPKRGGVSNHHPERKAKAEDCIILAASHSV